MPTPTIPPILTEADWNRKKGLIAKAAGETKIGAMLKDMTASYNLIKWPAFEAAEKLPAAAPPEQAAQTLAQAQLQFKKLPLLVKNLDALNKQALLIQTQFSKNKLIPAATTQHVGQIAAAAGRLRSEVLTVNKEFEALSKGWAARTNQRPSVRELVGERWMADMLRTTLYRDPYLAKWTSSQDVVKSARTGQVDMELLRQGDQLKAGMTALKTGLATLTRLQSQRLEPAAVRAQVVPAVEQIDEGAKKLLAAALKVTGPNYVDYQKKAAGAQQAAAWEKSHAELVKLALKVGTLTIPEARRLVKLVEQFDSIKLELLTK